MPRDRLGYQYVPKDRAANLEYRAWLLSRAADSVALQQDLRALCAEDLLFYVNAFCCIFEPRTALEHPFVTYPYQDEMFEEIEEAIGHHDLVWEKSRDQGASWTAIATVDWHWRLHDFTTFLLLSRKEELVDKKGDPKSLFSKLDFLDDRMPFWLRPPQERRKMHKRNGFTDATVDGESTNDFAGVADRRTALILDEFAKMPNQEVILKGTRDTTLSRIFIFTPEGGGNAAYKIAHNPNFRRRSIHWSRHPQKRKGLYKVSRQGDIEMLDKQHWTPEAVAAYPFVHKRPKNPAYPYRSPWYDNECRRAVSEQEIASELDIDYVGSDDTYFPLDLIEDAQELCREPTLVGELDFDHETGEPRAFIARDNGSLKLWLNLGADGSVAPGRRFAAGIDVSGGTGATPSVMSIVDRDTGEKIAEWSSNQYLPHDFAKVACAIGQFFNRAYLIWEHNGPGQTFGVSLQRLGYGNIFRRAEGKIGWFATRDGNANVMGAYRAALAGKTFTNRSVQALEECRMYVHTDGGGVMHRLSVGAGSPSERKTNHGDLAKADALANHLLVPKNIKRAPPPPKIPVGCPRWRYDQRQKQKRRSEGRWAA
jgi:hypothetical protein